MMPRGLGPGRYIVDRDGGRIPKQISRKELGGIFAKSFRHHLDRVGRHETEIQMHVVPGRASRQSDSQRQPLAKSW